MRVFGVDALSEHLVSVVEDRAWCERRELIAIDSPDATEVKPEEWRNVLGRLRRLYDFSRTHSLQSVFALLDAFFARHDEADRPPDIAGVKAHLTHVGDMVFNDIYNTTFLQVPQPFNDYIDNETLFGPTVYIAFPSATNDIREAGNCLAADCNTAAVFHLMRAVEWALRALAVHLGFRQLRVQKKSGKRKYVPLSHLEWEKILDALQVKVDKRIEKMRPGKRKQELQQFYYPALQEIRAVRDAWRNHTMHSRSEYSAKDADAIKGHAERLMVALAERISESGPSGRASTARVRRFPASGQKTP